MNFNFSNFRRNIYAKVTKIVNDVIFPYAVLRSPMFPYNETNIIVSLRDFPNLSQGNPEVGEVLIMHEAGIDSAVKDGERYYYAEELRPPDLYYERDIINEIFDEKGTNIVASGILSTKAAYFIRESRKSAANRELGGNHFVIHTLIDDPKDGIGDSSVLHDTTQEEVTELVEIGIEFAKAVNPRDYFAFALTGKGDRKRKHFHGHMIFFDDSDFPPIVQASDRNAVDQLILHGSNSVGIVPSGKRFTKAGIHHIIKPAGINSSLREFIDSFIVTYNATKNSSNWDRRLEPDRWRIIGFFNNNGDVIRWHIHQIWPREGDTLPRLVDPFNTWSVAE